MDRGRIRAFLAIDPSAATHAALVALKAEFTATRADVRWVRDGGLHCTLKFLGSVECARLERVPAAVAAALAGRRPVRAVARGLGVFPTPARPRVVWVGFDGSGLGNIAAAVDAALAAEGFASERRPFRAHITLGRVNGRRGWGRVSQVMAAHAEDDFGSTDVDRVVVYQSDLRPDGAVYTALWTIPMHGSSVTEETNPAIRGAGGEITQRRNGSARLSRPGAGESDDPESRAGFPSSPGRRRG